MIDLSTDSDLTVILAVEDKENKEDKDLLLLE